MFKIKSCPSCGSRNITKVRRDWSGTFRGQSYTVPSLEFYECPACGEKVYDRQSMREIEKYSPAFRRRRDSKVPATTAVE